MTIVASRHGTFWRLAAARGCPSLLLAAVVAACGEDPVVAPTVDNDTSPPGTVTDLTLASVTDSTFTLTWMAPGDDDQVGRVTLYDLRYSKLGVDNAAWESATPVLQHLVPSLSGVQEIFSVSGLDEASEYHVALKSADDAGNWSSLSNIVVGSTSGDPDTHWTSFGQQSLRLWELTVWDGRLVAAGFESGWHVYTWTGSDWVPLGGVFNRSIRVLSVHEGDLIAGGSFSQVDGVEVRRVARWNGSEWVPLGSGISSFQDNESVAALATYDGKLFAGGDFLQRFGVFLGRIAMWDGTSWQPVGEGISGKEVRTLAVFDGALIAGGEFEHAGGVEARSVARWDGTSWSALGAGVAGTDGPGIVASCVVFRGDLVVAGSFTTADGGFAGSIARWDGSEWRPLGLGLTRTLEAYGGWRTVVNALIVYRGKLVAGGQIAYADGKAAAGVARWNGSLWETLGSGIGPTDELYSVDALALFAGGLWVAGEFETAGANPSQSIARWDD